CLVVPCRRETQLDSASPTKCRQREEVAPIGIRAVGGEGVNLIRRIEPPQQPVTVTPIRVTANDHYIAVTARPFALNSHESWSQIEDQVIALDGVRRPHTDAELCGLTCDRELRDSTFLICRKHVVEASNDLG